MHEGYVNELLEQAQRGGTARAGTNRPVLQVVVRPFTGQGCQVRPRP